MEIYRSILLLLESCLLIENKDILLASSCTRKLIIDKSIILQLFFINELGEEFSPQAISRKHYAFILYVSEVTAN